MTADEGICERTWLPPSMCSHCRGFGWDAPKDAVDALEPDDPAPPRGGPVATITAELLSKCSGCGETIRPGDTIMAVNNRWVCGECADGEAEPW